MGLGVGGKGGCSLMSLENRTPLILPSGEAAKVTHLYSSSQFSHHRKDREAPTQITDHTLGMGRPPQGTSPPDVTRQQQC